MKKVISVWNMVAGVLWAVISLIFLCSLFGSMGLFGNASSGAEGAGEAIGLILILIILAGFIMCTVSLFISNYTLLKNGALMIAIVYSLLFLLLGIGLLSAASQTYVSIWASVIFLIAGLTVQAIAYFSLSSLAKKALNNSNVDSYWFRPAMYFGICLVCTLIALASLPNYSGGVSLNFGTFSSWFMDVLWIGALVFTGLAIKNPMAGVNMNQNGFVQPGGFNNQNMYGQQNGYMNQNMYGQPQNMYGQQNGYAQQPNAYVDPNAQFGNQQQNGYMNQNMYNQQPNAYADSNAQFGNQQQNGYMNQNMYNQQQNTYVDPNAQYNNQQ